MNLYLDYKKILLMNKNTKKLKEKITSIDDHTKEIYQAYLDSKPIEYQMDDGEWIDADPFICHLHTKPERCPERWRIKAERNDYFRVYRDRGDDGLPSCCVALGLGSLRECIRVEREIEEGDCFGGWLTDWIEYEKEEEE